MLKRLKTGKTNGANANNASDTNRTSSKKSRNEIAKKPAANSGVSKGDAEKDGANTTKKLIDVPNGRNGHNQSSSTSSARSSADSAPRKTPSVEEQLRDALQRNQQMEDAMRMIANEARITNTDTEQLDINDISKKVIQFVRKQGIPSPQPFNTEAANSALIESVFDELDEHERKYEEQIKDEFEDDVPPKKVH